MQHGLKEQTGEALPKAQEFSRSLPPPVHPAGRKGRVVLNHSTHVPRLIDVLNKLVKMKGISTLVPGVLSR